MPGKDPVDEIAEATFPASDAPPFSGAHAGAPADHDVNVLIEAAPGSADAEHFRTALARFDGRVTVTFAGTAGDDFARALPDAQVVVAGELADGELARAGRLRWFSSVQA